MSREILFLEPVLKDMIWGGSRLSKEFHYEKAGEQTGECWGISAHPNGDCVVAKGTFAGQSLSDLWNNHRELFGNLPGDRFPLMVKIIDAKTDLSIQVHPDDAYAKEHENGSLGKTECWYVLDCDEDTDIVIGHNAKNHEEVERMILNKEWDAFYRRVPVHKGDFFQIDPGCLHAIKGGTLILETQQNSDITYRVYDYDRLSNGKPRELHVKKSIDVIKAPFVPTEVNQKKEKLEGGYHLHLISCPFYSVDKYDVDGSCTLTQDKPFLNISIIEGEGSIDGIPVKKGGHMILPAGYGSFLVEGTLSFISSNVE